MTASELNKMTTEDLRAMNAAIVRILKARIKTNNVMAAQSFGTGDNVTFTSRGMTYHGVVVKVKQKFVEVNCGPQGRYNVAGAMLKLA